MEMKVGEGKGPSLGESIQNNLRLSRLIERSHDQIATLDARFGDAYRGRTANGTVTAPAMPPPVSSVEYHCSFRAIDQVRRLAATMRPPFLHSCIARSQTSSPIPNSRGNPHPRHISANSTRHDQKAVHPTWRTPFPRFFPNCIPRFSFLDRFARCALSSNWIALVL